MPLEWDVRQRLLRLAATADELASCAREARDDGVRSGVQVQIARLAEEVQAAVAAADPGLGEEFERVVSSADDDVPAEVRAAALVGWLKGALSAQAMDDKREGEAAQRRATPARKHTLGFKLRSPVTRQTGQPESGTDGPEAD